MQSIASWFSKFTAATHITFASVLVFVASIYAAYQNVPQVQTLFQHIYAAVPGWARLTIAAVVAWYAWYYGGEPVALKPGVPPNPTK